MWTNLLALVVNFLILKTLAENVNLGTQTLEMLLSDTNQDYL